MAGGPQAALLGPAGQQRQDHDPGKQQHHHQQQQQQQQQDHPQQAQGSSDDDGPPPRPGPSTRDEQGPTTISSSSSSTSSISKSSMSSGNSRARRNRLPVKSKSAMAPSAAGGLGSVREVSDDDDHATYDDGDGAAIVGSSLQVQSMSEHRGGHRAAMGSEGNSLAKRLTRRFWSESAESATPPLPASEGGSGRDRDSAWESSPSSASRHQGRSGSHGERPSASASARTGGAPRFRSTLSQQLRAAAELEAAWQEDEGEPYERIVSNPRYTPAQEPLGPAPGSGRTPPPTQAQEGQEGQRSLEVQEAEAVEDVGDAGRVPSLSCLQGLLTGSARSASVSQHQHQQQQQAAGYSSRNGATESSGELSGASSKLLLFCLPGLVKDQEPGGRLSADGHGSSNTTSGRVGKSQARSFSEEGGRGKHWAEALRQGQGPPVGRWGVERWWFGRVLDPREPHMRGWIRTCSVMQICSLVLVPCFPYTLGYDAQFSCLALQGRFAASVAALLCACDLLLYIQTYLSLRTAFVPFKAVAISQVELVRNARIIAAYNLSLYHGIWLDVLALLPVPQLYVLVVAPLLVQNSPPSYEWSTGGVTKGFVFVIIQYVLRVLYVARFHSRWQRVLGYIFSKAWWGFVLNLAGYLTCAHAFGALWYLFSVDRISQCYQGLCQEAGPEACNPTWITCPLGLGWTDQDLSAANLDWISSSSVQTTCFQGGGSFNFGIYETAVTLTENPNGLTRVVYGNFFGLMTLSSFGNALVPSRDFGETAFSVVMIVSGLMLFTLLIGNIQLYLQTVTAQIQDMQLRRGDLSFWMEKRHIPKDLQHRINRQEKQRFLITRGIDEDSLLDPLPRTLRRDIKRHICLDLVKKVPLFAAMDECVLDSICERLEAEAYEEDTVLVQQGEPVEKMYFVLRGQLMSQHIMSSGIASECEVEEGSFTGEELLSWGLSTSPSVERLPLASATLTTLSVVETFVLSAQDLEFVTSHFAFNLRSKRLRHWIRHYSPSWRAWAAVTIQIAWRRHRARKRLGKASTNTTTTIPPDKKAHSHPMSPPGQPRAAGHAVTPAASDMPRRDDQGEAADGTLPEANQGGTLESRRSQEPGRAPAQENVSGRVRFYSSILGAPKPDLAPGGQAPAPQSQVPVLSVSVSMPREASAEEAVEEEDNRWKSGLL